MPMGPVIFTVGAQRPVLLMGVRKSWYTSAELGTSSLPRELLLYEFSFHGAPLRRRGSSPYLRLQNCPCCNMDISVTDGG